jgi:protein SCO1/2
MSKPQKIITIFLWIIAIGGMIGIVAMKAMTTTGQKPAAVPIVSDPSAGANEPLPILATVPSFGLIDQDGKPATDSQFLGHPWIADFIFTTCASLCPTMSAHMADLQGQVPADVQLVSFSVDPMHDTPAALKDYAGKYHAQPGRWTFVTGDEQTVARVVRSMKLGFAPATADTPIQHDEHFVLIDAQGKIRGFYDSLVPQKIGELIHDAQTLSAHPNGAP